MIRVAARQRERVASMDATPSTQVAPPSYERSFRQRHDSDAISKNVLRST